MSDLKTVFNVAAGNISAFEIDQFVSAARDGDLDTIKKLSDQYGKIIINAHNDTGNTALICATANESIPIIKYLLANGADTEAKLAGDETALMIAARRGSTYIMRLLLDGGADMNTTDKNGWTALDWAKSSNETESAELLQGRWLEEQHRRMEAAIRVGITKALKTDGRLALRKPNKII